MWRDVLGVEVTLINEEFQVLLANIQSREVTQVFRTSWTGDYNDAHTFLSILQSDNAANLTGYQSEKYDSLMQSAADPDQQAFLPNGKAVPERIMPGNGRIWLDLDET